MVARITLTAENGPLKGKDYVLTGNQRCLVGRSKDCDFQLPEDFAFMTVSRHHCLLDVEPPRISVLDLGSRNGTYVNGRRLWPYGDPNGFGEFSTRTSLNTTWWMAMSYGWRTWHSRFMSMFPASASRGKAPSQKTLWPYPLCGPVCGRTSSGRHATSDWHS